MMNVTLGIPETGWRFMKIGSPFGRDLIQDWIQKLPIGDRGGIETELRVLLSQLRNLRAGLWQRPQFAWLSGKRYSGIGELIFDYGNVEYRMLGCFGPKKDQFTMLVGSSKQRKRRGKVQWNPEGAPDTAVDRRKWLDREDVILYEVYC